ncbi:MAG TPA: hypothetical protein VFK74_10985, partial [Azospira sp.]|nr:hypothetical protein [Azospira sp.]
MRHHLFRWLLVALLPLTLFYACGERKVASWRESQELVVLSSPGPLTYTRGAQDPGGEAGAGFEYDLVSLFAEEAGLKLKLVSVGNYREVAQALKRGAGHMAAAWLVWHPGVAN